MPDLTVLFSKIGIPLYLRNVVKEDLPESLVQLMRDNFNHILASSVILFVGAPRKAKSQAIMYLVRKIIQATNIEDVTYLDDPESLNVNPNARIVVFTYPVITKKNGEWLRSMTARTVYRGGQVIIDIPSSTFLETIIGPQDMGIFTSEAVEIPTDEGVPCQPE